MSTVAKKTGLYGRIISFLKNLFHSNQTLTVRPIEHASAVPPAAGYSDHLRRAFASPVQIVLPVIEVMGEEKPKVGSVFGKRR